MNVLIVGGVAGGATAAARIRRLDEQAQIIVFERSGYVSYANCGLPYYVGDVITDPKQLTLQTPESFKSRFQIDVRVRQEVVSIDTVRKCVTVRALDSGRTYEEAYDKLLLSPGAKPVLPNFPGIGQEGVLKLRTVEDAFYIKELLKTNRVKRAVIVGGGFIGVEVAENLTEAGIAVSIIEYAKQLLAIFDEDMASLVHTKLREKGVSLHLGKAVTGFVRENGQFLTQTADGDSFASDIVLVAVGVEPDTAIAREAGIELGLRGSILVNERMETSVPDIYAVGDAVEVRHFVTGQRALISLAGPANKQGRIAANNICGGNSVFSGSQGSSVIKLFDLTAGMTGVNERAAAAAGLRYEKIVLSPASHASYYPGAASMTMKVLYDKASLRILGAQIIGAEGVDKRIDVLATAIRAGMTAYELQTLDLAYAPPYSSAKDPVNMAGFMIDNLASGRLKQFHYPEVAALPRDGSVTLLDVRTPEEYGQGHAEGFENVPVDSLREHLALIPKGKPVYVMCQSGLRSYIACCILSGSGYDCCNFSGGYAFYKAVCLNQLPKPCAFPCGKEKSAIS